MTMAGAIMLDLQDRVGSLETGKDADFIVLTGDPLAFTRTFCKHGLRAKRFSTARTGGLSDRRRRLRRAKPTESSTSIVSTTIFRRRTINDCFKTQKLAADGKAKTESGDDRDYFKDEFGTSRRVI